VLHYITPLPDLTRRPRRPRYLDLQETMVVTQELRAPVHVPVAGLAAQLGLLAVLWEAGVCVGLTGWLAGTAYAVLTWFVLRSALRRSRVRTFGPANAVTLLRATLVGCVTAIAADALGDHEPQRTMVVIAAVALALDAVDGWIARTTGTVSQLGARFDMEVDAFLLLVLSVFVARSFGVWVLGIGLMRYAFGAAGHFVPWLRAPLPFNRIRRVIAGSQGIALVIAAADVAPPAAGLAVSAAALAALTYSFGRDTWWLWRTRRDEPAARRML
jgi:phosphatidylglycerophosphate synthase